MNIGNNHMLRRMCFLTLHESDGIKRQAMTQLCDALERQGVTTAIIDIIDTELNAKQIEQLLSTRPDVICSFGSDSLRVGRVLLGDYLKIPHLIILLESAIYHLHLAKSPYAILSCADYFDCELFVNAHCDRVFFLGPAVSAERLREPPERQVFDLISLDRFEDPEVIRSRWEDQYSDEVIQVLNRAVDIVLDDDHTAVPQALVNAWRVSGPDPTEHDFTALCRQVDECASAESGFELVHHLLGRDLLVPPLGKRPQEIWQDLKNSKILLSSSPTMKHGVATEIINGLAAGTLVVARANRYLEMHFSEEQGVVPYLHGDWEGVNERLQYYLADDAVRRARVEQGRKILGAEYTWDQRAEELIVRVSAFWEAIASENYIRTFN